MQSEPTLKHAAFLTTSRVEALSDGVFGVALTLLVTTFDFLKAPLDMSDEKFRQMVWDQWPDMLHYVESFLLVSAFWFEHHHQFHYIKRSDWQLRWLNLFGLMLVVLVPMTNLIVGDYGHLTVAAVLFEGNMLATGLISCLIWRYATQGRRLVDANLDGRVIRMHQARSLVIPALSAAAIVIALWLPRLSTLLYFLVPVLVLRIGEKDRKQMQREQKEMSEER